MFYLNLLLSLVLLNIQLILVYIKTVVVLEPNMLLNRNVADFDFIFISLSETWLTDSIFSNELGLLNYKVFRCDRSSVPSVHNRDGEVHIANRNDVSS